MFKSKLILTTILAFSLVTGMSQKIVRDHYTASAGILGAANFGKFHVSGNGSSDVDYDFKFGYSAGVWINFPLANTFSLEPQVMYSKYTYMNDDLVDHLLNEGKISYISVPLLFKFHMGPKFALTLGPQVDFFSNFEDKRGNAEKEDFTKTSFSAFGGFEVCPHSRVTLFGRFIYGFTNMDNTDNLLNTLKYHNEVIQVGLKLKLFGKHILADSDGDGVKDKDDLCPLAAGFERYKGCPIPDTDKDGFNDEVDKCPNEPGVEKYGGCPIPDTDKDGINDDEDKCPTVVGIAKYQGCPIPDTDGDGVNDEEDKCPTVVGLMKYYGCPIPDKDGDGINDEEDRCPDEPGVPEMKGCPRIEKFEASRVTFASGKSILTANGKKELDVVVAFMKRAPEALKINLVGHTDSTGSDKINDPLSQARADAAKAYLVSQGIDESKISAQGMGSHTPVAENKTVKGRAENRRVEVTVQ